MDSRTTDTQERYSLADLIGLYAYLFAVGGGRPDSGVVADLLRRQSSVTELSRLQSERRAPAPARRP